MYRKMRHHCRNFAVQVSIKYKLMDYKNMNDELPGNAKVSNRQYGELPLYAFPSLDILENRANEESPIDFAEHEANKKRLLEVLRICGIQVSQIESIIGSTVTRYEIIPTESVRIHSVRSLGDDLALALAAEGIRIIAPIPGKGTIGIEVPNKKPQIVGIRSILSSEAYQNSKAELPIAMGSTITNEVNPPEYIPNSPLP